MSQTVTFGKNDPRIEVGTDRTVFVTWAWSKKNTTGFRVKWYYTSGNKKDKDHYLYFLASDTTVASGIKQASYTAPANAKKVRVEVKPIAKVVGSGKKKGPAFVSKFKQLYYTFKKDVIPEKPATPSLSVNGTSITAEIDIYDTLADEVCFYLVHSNGTYAGSYAAKIFANHATAIWKNLAPSKEYSVRCWAINHTTAGDKVSPYSEYARIIVQPTLKSPDIDVHQSTTKETIQVFCSAISFATGYIVEYATKSSYFDTNSDLVESKTGSSTHFELSGLQVGNVYYFRVRATLDSIVSPWSKVVSITIGEKPAPPTTWSNAASLVVGENLIFYWVHNAKDGSSQTMAELEISEGENTAQIIQVPNSTDINLKDQTSHYEKITSEYVEGTILHWRVRTKGITDEYSDWSVMRDVSIFAQPQLTLAIGETLDGNSVDQVTNFPIYLSGITGPPTQKPISYYISIAPTTESEKIGPTGESELVTAGQPIFTKYMNANDSALSVVLTPGDVDFQNGVTYAVTCVVAMNSGLTTETTVCFIVDWIDEEYSIDRELLIDEETLSASIRPYCVGLNDSGEEIEIEAPDVQFSVYRRDFNGEFIQIATDWIPATGTYITDPHPALDYARYRIVAISQKTGSISFFDDPGWPINEGSVVIQWDEKWDDFYTDTGNSFSEHSWTGSMLKLPYNIDVTESNSGDVTLVGYQGRKRPVSYYGTLLGEGESLNVVVPKDDMETIYALRRLAIYQGDVYVRVPSGTGYWANVKVSMTDTHNELVIPVSITITRVDGGI